MADDSKQLERKRAATKAWVSSKALTTLLSKPTDDVTKTVLQDAIADFDQRLGA